MRALVAGFALMTAAAATAQLRPPAELPRLMTARSVASLPAAQPTATIAHGDAPAQRVELYLPRQRGEGLLPVVVMVHGGCWRADVAGIELIRPAAAAFLERGWAVWAVGYRRTDEAGGGYPGTFQDVAAGIDLLRDQAGTHGLDPGRIVFWGHSAGGHLALWAAGRPRIPAASPLAGGQPLRPLGVVTVGALPSLEADERRIALSCGPDVVPALAPGDGPERFADTSPDKLLPLGVPSVLVHGVYDHVAMPFIGLTFATAARAAGDRSDVQPAPVAGHFEPIAPGTAAFAQAMAAIETLIGR